METYIVRFYAWSTSTKSTIVVEAYSMIEAIDIVRNQFSYGIMILSIKYLDEDKVIRES